MNGKSPVCDPKERRPQFPPGWHEPAISSEMGGFCFSPPGVFCLFLSLPPAPSQCRGQEGPLTEAERVLYCHNQDSIIRPCNSGKAGMVQIKSSAQGYARAHAHAHAQAKSSCSRLSLSMPVLYEVLTSKPTHPRTRL